MRFNKWIVGLGNPGNKYRYTRHNAGFLAVECFTNNSSHSTFEYPEGVLCIRPSSGINLSGEYLKSTERIYGKPERMLVIYDDINISIGEIKQKKESSGTSTHNGVKDVIRHFGNDFDRIRVGIGLPPKDVSLLDHVLGEFNMTELITLNEALIKAKEFFLEWLK